MKHEKKIDKLLEDIFRQDWMDDEYYNTCLELIFKYEITKQKLSDHIETGISNGYTLEEQLRIVKKYLG